MKLEAGRVREMVDEARADESTIVCHETLDGDNAACRGFFDRYPTASLQIAERLGMLVEIDPPASGSVGKTGVFYDEST